jgi:hypothetical protein
VEAPRNSTGKCKSTRKPNETARIANTYILVPTSAYRRITGVGLLSGGLADVGVEQNQGLRRKTEALLPRFLCQCARPVWALAQVLAQVFQQELRAVRPCCASVPDFSVPFSIKILDLIRPCRCLPYCTYILIITYHFRPTFWLNPGPLWHRPKNNLFLNRYAGLFVPRGVLSRLKCWHRPGSEKDRQNIEKPSKYGFLRANDRDDQLFGHGRRGLCPDNVFVRP